MKEVLFAGLLLVFSGCSSNRVTLNTDVKQRYIDYFQDEVKPVQEKPCFQGAYYRKLVSSVDQWIGISGTVILPTIVFDENRKNPKNTAQYLDNPSIYMGGHVDGQETDIGLSWEVIRDKEGKVSKERLAFRPFLRRTDHHSGEKAVFLNAPAQEDYYWYPGEQVFMSLQTIADGKVKFVVQGADKVYETIFDCAGYRLDAAGEFKRVNAIDQMGNEGKPVQATNTQVSGATWLQTNLMRIHNGKVIQVPFHEGRYTEMNCPDTRFFTIESTSKERLSGAERIRIYGAGHVLK